MTENIFFNVADLAELGEGSIVGKTVRIRRPKETRIGQHAIVDDFTYIACSLHLGDYSHIGSNCSISGGNRRVTIGDFVNIAPGCRIFPVSNDYSTGGLVGAAIPSNFAAEPTEADILIADHVLLGSGTVVLPGVHIPEGAATGANTLITPRVQLEPWTLYVGTPARALRPRESSDILEASKRLRGRDAGQTDRQ